MFRSLSDGCLIHGPTRRWRWPRRCKPHLMSARQPYHFRFSWTVTPFTRCAWAWMALLTWEDLSAWTDIPLRVQHWLNASRSADDLRSSSRTLRSWINRAKAVHRILWPVHQATRARRLKVSMRLLRRNQRRRPKSRRCRQCISQTKTTNTIRPCPRTAGAFLTAPPPPLRDIVPPLSMPDWQDIYEQL